jgi:predicted acetyltransferase
MGSGRGGNNRWPNRRRTPYNGRVPIVDPPLDPRPFTVDDLPEIERFLVRAFAEADPSGWAIDRSLFEPDRSLAVREDGELIGTTWIQSLRVAVPGGVRPVAGVTGVAVSPVRRRRGVLSALMDRQLADIHARGEALAALWATEPAIYGRFGYGLAAPVAAIHGERAHLRFPGPEPAGIRLRLTDSPDTERLNAVQVAASRPGTIRRDATRWRSRLDDRPEQRDGASALAVVLAEATDGADLVHNGGAEGYGLYRTRRDRRETGPDGVVEVIELVAATARALRSLWRYVSSLDLTEAVTAHGLAVDDPLFHLVDDPEQLEFRVMDGLFVRLVDLPGALAGRGYRHPAAAAVEVVDDHCPWNAGRWRIDVSPDGVSCERTAAPADLTLSAAELGAAYLGGPTLRTLALAGRVDEHSPGVLGPLSDAFAGDLAPQCYEDF